MTPKIIVSYDDTDNDRDALALGDVFAQAGAEISLAYVCHGGRPARAAHETEEQHAARLLERGARALRLPDAERHVVRHASTGEGLWELAERTSADAVVFGSDYRVPAGSVRPGTSAQRLLEGGPVAVAVAPAGLRDRPALRIARVGILAEPGDEAADETAGTLARALGAVAAEPGEARVDLLVAGSRAEAAPGQVRLSAAAEYSIETSGRPVLVVPRGRPVAFATPALAAS
jgi:nucleotide-binding universal stress UspA family protein